MAVQLCSYTQQNKMNGDNVDVFEFDQVTKELLSFFQSRG